MAIPHAKSFIPEFSWEQPKNRKTGQQYEHSSLGGEFPSAGQVQDRSGLGH